MARTTIARVLLLADLCGLSRFRTSKFRWLALSQRHFINHQQRHEVCVFVFSVALPGPSCLRFHLHH